MKQLTISFDLYEQELKDEFTKGWNRASKCFTECLKNALELKAQGKNDAAWHSLFEFFDNTDDTNKLAQLFQIYEPKFSEEDVPF